MPFPHALESSSQVQVQVQLLPQRLAGLPELCVVLSGLVAQPVHYFLDQGFVETMTSCDEPPEGKRRRVGGEAEEMQEDIEAIYFPSDVKELLDLAEKAVKEGAGNIGDDESGWILMISDGYTVTYRPLEEALLRFLEIWMMTLDAS